MSLAFGRKLETALLLYRGILFARYILSNLMFGVDYDMRTLA